MLTLGLRVMNSPRGRHVRGVFHDSTEPRDPTTIDHACDGSASPARQAKESSEWLSSELAGRIGVAAVLLFEADRSPRPSDTDSTRNRLRIEGALLAAAATKVPIVEVRNGRELGSLLGVSKATALARGADLNVPSVFAEASAAAIAAIELAE